MKILKTKKIIFFISLMLLVMNYEISSVFAVSKIQINKINVSHEKDETKLEILFSEPPETASMIELSDPYRLIIELDGKNIYYKKTWLKVNQGLVKRIRFELKESVLKTKEVEYISVELFKPFTHRSVKNEKKWIIQFKDRFPKFMEEKPLKTIKGKLDIIQAIQIARSNHVPLKISREKIILTKMRKNEALRALFPAMTFKYEQTEGESRGELNNLSLYEYREKFMNLQI